MPESRQNLATLRFVAAGIRAGAQPSWGRSNRAVRLESVYTRLPDFRPPLTDGYHFGQTLFNRFWRPVSGRFNAIAGSGLATAGDG